MIIKRIDLLSAGKIGGIIAAAIGLIAGVMFFLFSSMFGAMMGSMPGNHGAAAGMIGGAAGIIVLPIMYGIFGFIGAIIQAFIYNLAAGWVGGIRIETE